PPTVPAAARSPVPWENPALGLPLCGLLVGLVLLWAWYGKPGRLTAAGLLAAVALDMGLFAWFAAWRTESFPAAALRSAPESVAGLVREVQDRRERLLAVAPLIPTPRGMPLDAVPVNLSRHWGVPAALGYTPLGLQRYGPLLPGAWPLHSGKVE